MKIVRISATPSPESKPAAILARQCERALVAAVRSARVSTRKRIHRAAHQLVHRHVRNRRSLACVFQRIVANGSLAVALLGLGQGVARAAAPVFDPFPTNPAPFDGTVLSAAGVNPSVADLDGDGDFDLLISSNITGIPTPIRLFENTGSDLSPVYTERTGSANPLNGFPITQPATPAVVDLNRDGKLDIVAADGNGVLIYLVNSGTPTAASFVVSPSDPFAGHNIGSIGTASLGDLDGDGDLDLVAGNRDGALGYMENTGTAVAPAFVPRGGSANPLDGFATTIPFQSDFTSPSLGDFDRDGDLDVAIGQYSPTLRYLENTGSATSPVFRELLQAANPFRGEAADSFISRLAVADLDADGDLDLVRGVGARVTRLMNQFGLLVPSEDVVLDAFMTLPLRATLAGDFDGDGDLGVFGQNCEYLDNVGTAIDPQFAHSSLPGISQCGAPPGTPGFLIWSPGTVDLDNDGDLDIVVGEFLYPNVGSATAPSFGTPVQLFSFLPGSAPLFTTTFADMDADGDIDMVAGDQDNSVFGTYVNRTRYFERTGSVSSFTFVERTGSANPLDVVGSERTVILSGDVDGDGDTDGFRYRGDGIFNPVLDEYLENIGTNAVPAFAIRSLARNPLFQLPLLAGSKLVFPMKDIDGDGDLDGLNTAVVSSIPLIFHLSMLENGIVRPSPRFNGPITALSGTLDTGSFSSLGAGDLDGDGDPDLVASSGSSGALFFYENIGSTTTARWVERVGSGNPLAGFNAGSSPILAMGDLDTDGDFDLLSGTGGSLRYFQNTGTTTAPAFIELVGTANPADGVAANRPAPSLGDIDRDGDLDIVLGSETGTFRLFRNTGNASSPAFVEITGTANPFNGLVAGIGFISNPALGDVDLDGDLDLLSGDELTGGFHYFENTGTATAPAFVARTGLDNPADGKSVGFNSTPALVDLDGDSGLDLMSGNNVGKVETFFLPEPTRGMLLTTGIALLGWLSRRRA